MKIKKLWSFISDYGILPEHNFDEKKGIRILNQFSFIGIAVALYYTVILLCFSAPDLVIFDLDIGILGVLVILLNKKFGYRFAGAFMLITIPIALLLLNYVYGHVGAHYYFFSLFILSFYMFGKNKILAVFGLYLICLFGISLYFETTIIPTGTAAILAPYFLFANITFAFIIGFLFLRLFVLEHEKNQKEIQNKNMLLQNAVEEADVRNEEIKTLLRELNHRTKNNLQLISSLLSIQSSRLSDSAAKSALEDSKNRIVSIIMLNQKLYSGNNVSKVSVREYLDDLILHLCALYNGSCDDIKLVIDIDDIYINIDTATALGLLVNELITNSFKHGISGAQTEEISVVLKSQNDSNIELFIMDSGKGIELLNEIHKNNSFGKMLIHSLVKQLNGSIIIGENNNNSARITFPMYKQDFTLNND